MKTGLKPLIALLTILGIGDLVMVPFMLAANHHTANAIPVPAIILGAVLGVATLASSYGVARGHRWGFVLAGVTRVLDVITALLGAFAGPAIGFHIVGAVTVVLSVGAIALLVRLNPRRAPRRAASSA